MSALNHYAIIYKEYRPTLDTLREPNYITWVHSVSDSPVLLTDHLPSCCWVSIEKAWAGYIALLAGELSLGLINLRGRGMDGQKDQFNWFDSIVDSRNEGTRL